MSTLTCSGVDSGDNNPGDPALDGAGDDGNRGDAPCTSGELAVNDVTRCVADEVIGRNVVSTGRSP
jgi:hypothetical protein